MAKHGKNFILTKTYPYFNSCSYPKPIFGPYSPVDMNYDKIESKGALESVLEGLKQIHNIFFKVCPNFLLLCQ